MSPAFDINPSIDKDGLALNIDTDSNALDLQLVKSVGMYLRLDETGMNHIDEVRSAVSDWQRLASEIGISRAEQTLMSSAFKI